MTSPSRLLLPEGIYTPIPTFFTPNEDLDLAALAAHVKFTVQAGTFPVVAGSAGEAPHLTRSERVALIQTTRRALLELDSSSFSSSSSSSCVPGRAASASASASSSASSSSSIPLVAGVGAPSTRETIALAREAAEVGADFVLVIPPGYYAGTLMSGDRAALRAYFVEVAEASPVPVVLYNFPAVSGGIDLDSDLIVEVARRSGNVAGVKLTCASVGKITRINALVGSEAFRREYPRRNPGQVFRIIDGFIDILLPSIASGAAGAISGLPNIAPLVCVRLWELGSSGAGPGSVEFAEAQRLQNIIALADGIFQGIGIPGLKMMIRQRFGYGANPRRPLPSMSDEQGASLFKNAYVVALMEAERQLEPV